MARTRRNIESREHGVAAVEFAIVLPLLLLAMLAVAELGRAFYQYNTLKKAVRDGARYLAGTALNGTTGLIDISPQSTATQNLVVYGSTEGGTTPLLPGLAPDDVTITAVTTPGNVVPTEVEVTASYAYQPIFGGILPTFGLNTGSISTTFVLTASNSMRAL